MRKRVIGVGAVILVVVGSLLGFRGFGTGEGDNGEADGDNVQVSLASMTTTTPSEEAEETPDSPPTSEPPDVLTLLVDDDRYLIQWGEDWHAEFSSSTLDEIVSKMDDVPGDENGVRVRLRFKENAQNGAIEDLKTALTDAGVDPEAIIEDSEYVE